MGHLGGAVRASQNREAILLRLKIERAQELQKRNQQIVKFQENFKNWKGTFPDVREMPPLSEMANTVRLEGLLEEIETLKYPFDAELLNLYRKALTAARDIHNTNVFIIFPDLSNVFKILIDHIEDRRFDYTTGTLTNRGLNDAKDPLKQLLNATKAEILTFIDTLKELSRNGTPVKHLPASLNPGNFIYLGVNLKALMSSPDKYMRKEVNSRVVSASIRWESKMRTPKPGALKGVTKPSAAMLPIPEVEENPIGRKPGGNIEVPESSSRGLGTQMTAKLESEEVRSSSVNVAGGSKEANMIDVLREDVAVSELYLALSAYRPQDFRTQMTATIESEYIRSSSPNVDNQPEETDPPLPFPPIDNQVERVMNTLGLDSSSRSSNYSDVSGLASRVTLHSFASVSSFSSQASVYSHASSRTKSFDYGLYYTRRALSLESLPDSLSVYNHFQGQE